MNKENTSKLWKAGKFIDRFDSRISSTTSNRFYLDRRVQMSLRATYSQVLHNSDTYSRCEYCREMHHKGMNEVGGIDFICINCCVPRTVARTSASQVDVATTLCVWLPQSAAAPPHIAT